MSKQYLVSLSLLFIFCGCATFRAEPPPGVVSVIAHRGASHDAPENTLAAFRRAWEMGADWFELDCYLTRDGEVLVIHDSNLERTTGIDGLVADFELAALRQLDAGAWKNAQFSGEPLPTLDESLAFAKNRIGVYVELKNVDDDGELMARLLDMAQDAPVMTPPLAQRMMAAIEASDTRNLVLTRKSIALIRAHRMERSVVIQSFSPVICAIVRIQAPDLRVELLSGVKADKHAEWEMVSRWTFLLDVHGLNLNGDGLTPGRLAAVQGAGKTVAVWTINDRAAMRRFADMGVDAIITDRPDLCLRVLGR